MKKEVYCEDCTYVRDIKEFVVKCQSPAPESYIRRKDFYSCEAIHRNRYGDCSSYKRKWWKFWR